MRYTEESSIPFKISKDSTDKFSLTASLLRNRFILPICVIPNDLYVIVTISAKTRQYTAAFFTEYLIRFPETPTNKYTKIKTTDK